MKRLLPVVMGFALLLFSSTEGWSLPSCPGSPASVWIEYTNWTDCNGTYTYANGKKYVGEFKDNKPNGQGTSIYPDGTVVEGIFENGNFFMPRNPHPQLLPRRPPSITLSLSWPTCYPMTNTRLIRKGFLKPACWRRWVTLPPKWGRRFTKIS